jgi:predicted alpha/beta hydrolase family esterase
MFQFSPARVVALGQSRVPIVVIVQTDDQAMPTARQLELAKNLGVEPVVFVGGHMEAFEVSQNLSRFRKSLMKMTART